MNTTLLALVIYFIITFAIAWYFSRKESLEEYLINKKRTGLVLLMLSNIATIIGAGAVVAVVAEVYNTGISYGIMLPASLMFGALLLGLMAHKLKEFSDIHKSYTIVDFFRIRFDKKNETLVVIMQLFLLTVRMHCSRSLEDGLNMNQCSNTTSKSHNFYLLNILS